jgi:hypothetical protein
MVSQKPLLVLGYPATIFETLMEHMVLQDFHNKVLLITDVDLPNITKQNIFVKSYDWLRMHLDELMFDKVLINLRFDLIERKVEEDRTEILKRVLDKGHNKIVFLSSIAVYGENCSDVRRTSIAKPRTIYGQKKLELEKLIIDNVGSNNVVILRISNIINLEDIKTPLGAIYKLLSSSISEKRMFLSETRDYVDKEFVCAVIAEKLYQFRNERIESLVIGSGKSISHKLLIQKLGLRVNINHFGKMIVYKHPIPEVKINVVEWQDCYLARSQEYSEELLVEEVMKRKANESN